MERTQFVLDEAEFFLNKMIEEQENMPCFNYYLNAFISSARSTLWIMQSEYQSVPGWKDWYDGTDVDRNKEKLLKGIVDLRNRSVKNTPLQIREEYIIGDENNSFNLFDEFRSYDGKRIDLTIRQDETPHPASRNVSGNTITLHGTVRKVRIVDEFRNRDIIDVCNEYLLWLKETFNLCVVKFG